MGHTPITSMTMPTWQRVGLKTKKLNSTLNQSSENSLHIFLIYNIPQNTMINSTSIIPKFQHMITKFHVAFRPHHFMCFSVFHKHKVEKA